MDTVAPAPLDYNPCEMFGEMYHKHEDPAMFIQCNWGVPYIHYCPEGTVWKQELQTCGWYWMDSSLYPEPY